MESTLRYFQIIVAFIIIGMCAIPLRAQFTGKVDSVASMRDSLKQPIALLTPQSLGVQFAAGEISYTIPFWLLAYPRIQQLKGHYSDFPDLATGLEILLACVAAPIGIDLSLGLLHWDQVSVGWGVAGSILGLFIARLCIQSDATYGTVLYSGVASVITSMLFYDLIKLMWPGQ